MELIIKIVVGVLTMVLICLMYLIIQEKRKKKDIVKKGDDFISFL